MNKYLIVNTEIANIYKYFSFDSELITQALLWENLIVLDKKNIGLEFNPDGTANTDYIIYKAKTRVWQKRLTNTANNILVTGHPSPIPYIGE